MAELSVIGVNHRTASVAAREPWALSAGQAMLLLKAMHAEKVFDEALVLSTCNRTECYFAPRGEADALAYLVEHVARIKGAPAAADAGIFYRHDDREAVRHLFRVAASLDSQIVGEHQILGQVKEAYRLAVESRTAGFLLNKLLHRALRTGKRVQTETDLGRGSASVAQAAVELARHIFTNLEGKTVLLVGAGQTAECAARTLLACGAARLIVANRTLQRAEQLAYDLVHKPAKEICDEESAVSFEAGRPPATCPALLASGTGATAAEGEVPEEAAPAPEHPVATEAIGLENIPAAITRADLVIASTGAPQPVLTYEGLAEVLRRHDGAVLMIDIAVPRDVDPRLGRLDNVFLYNMDDLDRLVAVNLERRRQEIPRAEAIVEDEVREFSRWLASREVAPTLRLLQEHLASIRQAQIERYGRKFTAADREQLQQFAQGLVGQILHQPIAMLKDLSADGSVGERLALVDTLRRLFDLDALEKKPRP